MFRIIVVFCLLFIIGSFFGLLVISNMGNKKKWLKAITFIIVVSAFASPFIFFTGTIIVCLDRLCTLWAGEHFLTSYTLSLQLPRVAQPIFLSYTLANRRLKHYLASYTLFTVYHSLQRGYRNSFCTLYTLLSSFANFLCGYNSSFYSLIPCLI